MRIGFVGLGVMGMPMAENLARSGASLVVYDVDPERNARGGALGTVAGSVAEVADGCDVMFSMLPADHHVLEATLGPDGVAKGARNRLLYMDLSTIGPSTLQRVRAEMPPSVRVLGGSCMRGVEAAKRGTLSLFVDGQESDCMEVEPILRPMASTILRVGALGASKMLKIVNNFLVATTDVFLAEVFTLAEKQGLSVRGLAARLAQGPGRSWALQNHMVAAAIADDLGPGKFSTRYMQKDLALALRLAHESGLDGTYMAMVVAYYRGTIAHGMGDSYHPIVWRWIRAGAGLPASWDPDAGDDGSEAALAVLLDAVTAFTAILSFEGLAIAQRAGVPWRQAASFLNSGSAHNAVLEQISRTGAFSWPGTSVGDLERTLDAALGVCAERNMPGIMLELSREKARRLSSLLGPEEPLEELYSRGLATS